MQQTEITTYYDEDYFSFQRDIGEFSGWAEMVKFQRYVKPNAAVVDFGCGTGFILKNLKCAMKMGVEINDTARAFAKRNNGIDAVKTVDELEDNFADLIISNHALEHCFSPHAELKQLFNKLKPGGMIVFYIPFESIHYGWDPDDINKHLYTWNPMTAGNLFASAGFEVESAVAFHHLWPPLYRKVALLGYRVFTYCSYIHGYLQKRNSQVRVVARRPKN